MENRKRWGMTMENKSNIIIRWATHRDALEIARVHTDGWKVAYKNIIPDHILDNISVEKRCSYFTEALKEKREETAVLIIDNQIIGFLTLGPNRDDDLDESHGEIWGIYLSPKHWGIGHGKTLMKWGIDQLNQKGYKKITLWVLQDNTKSRKFYERLGFQEDGVKEITLGIPLKEVRYIKVIGNKH